ARSAVRSAAEPALPAGLLASLRSIPDTVDLPRMPAGLAVTGDGTVVSVATDPIAGTARLGSALGLSALLGTRGLAPRAGADTRTARQGAGD
ncbi:MAG: hypothetical protein ACRDRZ_12195, partial [Pseudonocardiaceae bacterium]